MSSKKNKSSAKTSKSCRGKKTMLIFGFTKLLSSAITAISLAVIAISFCTVKTEAGLFNECVEEVLSSSELTTSSAVRFCNGGN